MIGTGLLKSRNKFHKERNKIDKLHWHQGILMGLDTDIVSFAILKVETPFCN